MTTSAYCRDACDLGTGNTRCGECPAPSLIPEAWAGAMAYAAVQTQWRADGGLDYAACAPVLRGLLRKWRAEDNGLADGLDVMDLLEDVQVVEIAILEVRAEQREQARGTRP